MLSDKHIAEIPARKADGTLNLSPEVMAAIRARAHAARALEMQRIFGGALRWLGVRFSSLFARTPHVATR